MLVIHGTEDPVIPVEEARWALAHAPMNTHLIVENAGHLVYCDADSAELVASTVSQFCMKRPCITCF
jgi:pimeloyl-ACP methyl ester carboxylesterase